MSVVLASAFSKENTWFIYRHDGKQVEFTIVNGKIRSYIYKLTETELNYIKKNILLDAKD